MENANNNDKAKEQETDKEYDARFIQGIVVGCLGGIVGGILLSMAVACSLLKKTERYVYFNNQTPWQIEQGYAHPSDISIYLEDKNEDGKDELYLRHKTLHYGVLYDPQTNRCSIRPYRIITTSDHTQRPRIVYEDKGK